MMIFFNDQLEVPDPEERAVRMAVAMRGKAIKLHAKWIKRGYELHLGAGIASGYATIGTIGFEGRCDYGVVGTVVNLAARLCGEARPGQLLVSQRFLNSVENLVQAELLGERSLKGFHRSITTYNVVGLKNSSEPAPIPS